ncbi:MAG: hypothetical protein GWN84_18020 [Gammaproteobacteria bacterium]|nr:hypothetical protein [Gammaproteobacteria bacterium]NIR84738.1 hypothetical protein [Gammaproteobacteria bacterium]NIR91234.1 hypothetical protein [Gammaproteobacteria bacterium]NIU05781.1 hypothetical protein [Gammaproteobacteria bacterium]NIV52900.1 hypothetical protein [Gammaproteobacteria bacterium]
MSNEKAKKVLWWVCLFLAPLVLLTIELFHPAGFTSDPGMYQYLSMPQPHSSEHKALAYFGPQWWFVLHMIQTPMVGLVSIGLWLMLDEVDRRGGILGTLSAWISRVATFVFLIYYTALDSIGGIGLGRVIEITETLAKASPGEPHLTPDQLAGVVLVLNTMWTDQWVGGVGSLVSLTGSWAVFVAALFAAIALFVSKKVSWPPLIVLIAFGWQLQLSHASLHGPIAFALLIVAALWIWRQRRRSQAQQRD